MHVLSALCAFAALSVALGAIDPALERRWRPVFLYLVVAFALGAASCALWPVAA